MSLSLNGIEWDESEECLMRNGSEECLMRNGTAGRDT